MLAVSPVGSSGHGTPIQARPEICSVHFGGEKGRSTCVSASSLDPQPKNTWMNVMETWQSPNLKAEISHQFQVLYIKHLGS